MFQHRNILLDKTFPWQFQAQQATDHSITFKYMLMIQMQFFTDSQLNGSHLQYPDPLPHVSVTPIYIRTRDIFPLLIPTVT